MSKQRKISLNRLTALVLPVALTLISPAHASLREEQPLADQAVKKVLGATEKVMKQSPFNFDAGVCFGIGVIGRGSQIQTPYPLQRGVRYLIIGGGDINAQDVNLALLDANGKTVAQDAAPDAVPVVFFTPKYTGNYKLALRLKKGRTSTSFCSVVVMRKTGGYALPVSSIRAATQSSQKLSPEMNQVASRLRFHRLRNQWAAFGAVLKQGDVTAIPGLKYETGNHIFVGGSDGRSTDMDLFLLSSSGQRLAESRQAGAAPAFAYQTNSNQTYQLALVNRRSKGASLVFLIALDVNASGGAVTGTQGSGPKSGGPIKVRLNGKMVPFEEGGAVEINGRVMVPLRELFEALGAKVTHNRSNNSYRISEGENVIVLKVGSPVMTVNNRSVRMDAPPMMYRGTAMVPLRFFIQAAGARVDWNQQQRIVSIDIAEDADPNEDDMSDNDMEDDDFEDDD